MPLEPTMPLETVVDITHKNKVHALLTLPARGYVEVLDAAQQLLSRAFSAQATTIQAAWRGRLGRKKTLELVRPVVHGDLEIEAATKIQAVARGRCARRRRGAGVAAVCREATAASPLESIAEVLALQPLRSLKRLLAPQPPSRPEGCFTNHDGVDGMHGDSSLKALKVLHALKTGSLASDTTLDLESRGAKGRARIDSPRGAGVGQRLRHVEAEVHDDGSLRVHDGSGAAASRRAERRARGGNAGREVHDRRARRHREGHRPQGAAARAGRRAGQHAEPDSPRPRPAASAAQNREDVDSRQASETGRQAIKAAGVPCDQRAGSRALIPAAASPSSLASACPLVADADARRGAVNHDESHSSSGRLVLDGAWGRSDAEDGPQNGLRSEP